MKSFGVAEFKSTGKKLVMHSGAAVTQNLLQLIFK